MNRFSEVLSSIGITEQSVAEVGQRFLARQKETPSHVESLRNSLRVSAKRNSAVPQNLEEATIHRVFAHNNTFEAKATMDDMIAEVRDICRYLPEVPSVSDADAEMAGRKAVRGMQGFYAWGPSGCGKTFSVTAMLNHFREHFFISGRVANLIDTMFEVRNHRQYGDRLYAISQMADVLSKTPLLVLDDVDNVSKISEEMDLIYLVLDRRMRAELPTIVTANVSLEELGRKFCDVSQTDGAARFTRLKSLLREELHFTGGNLRSEPRRPTKLRLVSE